MLRLGKIETNKTHFRNGAFIFLLLVITTVFTLQVTAQNYIVNSNIDAVAVNLVTGDAGGGVITLRSAIQAANTQPGAHIITFSDAVANPIILTLGQITVGNAVNGNNITITGPGMNALTVNQTTENRIFSTGTGAVAFLLQDITLNYAGPAVLPYSGGGGAIIAGGAGASTTLINCKISNFKRQIGNGGAISASSSLNNHSLTITNCVFTDNKCGGAGGAVSFNSQGGTATITGCTFTNNRTGIVGANTGGDGGAVSTTGGGSGGTYLIEKNTFLNNQAESVSSHAGAVMNTNGTLTLRFNRFIGNTCANVSFPPLANIIGQAGGATVHTTIADNNWWGLNTGPVTNDATALAAGAIMTLGKWLQLKTTASPNPICNTTEGLGNTSTVTAGFLSNSTGEAVAITNLPVLIGLPITWSQTLGSLSLQQSIIQPSGTSSALFTSDGTGGTATVNAVVDNLTATENSPSRVNITINTLPTVTTPTNTITCVGSTATFTSSVTGTPAPTIHWRIGTTDLIDGLQVSGSTVSGAGTTTLTISNVQTGDAVSMYNVQASNHCGIANSSNADLTVNIPSVAPSNISGTTVFCSPGSTTLTAEGGTLGTGANYQWGTGSVVGTSPLPGQTAATLTVSPTTTTTYWVQIENTASPCTPNTGGPSQVVTVNQPSSAPTGISGTTTICSGSTTTLTATGGTLGTGANYQWGSGSVIGSSPLIGEIASTLTVSPVNTSTYWVQIVNTASPCTETTGGVAQLITVHQPSVAPSGITGITTICNGSSTMLTATGGTLGTSAHYQWGTGSVIGTSPITGETSSTINVSPASNTTYWVRIEGTASPCITNTSGITQAITVNKQSIAPSGATGNTTICSGSSTMLTVAGGTKGTGATTEWFIGSCGGTSAGTGDAIMVSPTTTTTYYVRYIGTCNTTTCASVTVSLTSNNTISLTSGVGTDAQSVCINTPISNITFATTGATGANFIGLPAGVTGSWLANGVTISGTPSVSGAFNYTATLTGGCGNASTSGSLSVNPAPSITAPNVTQPTCAAPEGTIVVNATGIGTLEYRLNSGTWHTSNTFSPGAGNYSIAVRSQSFPACVTNYGGNPVVLNAATGCTVPPTIICPSNITTTAGSGQCNQSVSFTVSATGVPAPTVVCKIGATVITSPYTFPVGTTTVSCTATNVAGTANCSFTVTVNDNQPPVINTIANPVVMLWPPNRKYQTLTVAQFVTSVTDNCGNIPVSNVFIMKVTSDEAEDAPGDADGNTTQDIKIASDCKSVDLRSERMEGGNGRVYTIFFTVNDGKGNTTTTTAKAIVGSNKSAMTVVEDGVMYTVNSSCYNSILTQTKFAPGSDTEVKLQKTVMVQNHPNPFSSFTTIRYQLPADAQVSLIVYNSLGQRIAHLVNGRMSAGKHAVRFEASDRVAGIYWYLLKTTDANGTPVEFSRKMVIVK